MVSWDGRWQASDYNKGNESTRANYTGMPPEMEALQTIVHGKEKDSLTLEEFAEKYGLKTLLPEASEITHRLYSLTKFQKGTSTKYTEAGTFYLLMRRGAARCVPMSEYCTQLGLRRKHLFTAYRKIIQALDAYDEVLPKEEDLESCTVRLASKLELDVDAEMKAVRLAKMVKADPSLTSGKAPHSIAASILCLADPTMTMQTIAEAASISTTTLRKNVQRINAVLKVQP